VGLLVGFDVGTLEGVEEGVLVGAVGIFDG
jgi:hypothetical protein